MIRITLDKKTAEKINRLKNENDAVVLAHNYQIPAIQDAADFVGDSLDLAKTATEVDAENIVFCGVDFMAESAKILNPDKTIIHPSKQATCPMAALVDVPLLEKRKEEHPGAEIVAYVNTNAQTKAVSDICCTSSNGVKVVQSLSTDTVIFVPDQNLGQYIQRFIDDKKMIIWSGLCPTHYVISLEEINELKEKHPEAEILVHPECRPEVIDAADHAYSTNGMVKHAAQSDAAEFIIGTEKELCYRLKKENPEKSFYPVGNPICPDMKKITLEKLVQSLETLQPMVELPDEIMKKAWKPLKRMMDIGRGD